jgi:hypothetical protein
LVFETALGGCVADAVEVLVQHALKRFTARGHPREQGH